MLQPDHVCAFFTTPVSSSNLRTTPVLQAFGNFTAFGMARIRECRKICNTLADSRYSSYVSRSNLLYVTVSVFSIPANFSIHQPTSYVMALIQNSETADESFRRTLTTQPNVHHVYITVCTCGDWCRYYHRLSRECFTRWSTLSLGIQHQKP